MKFVWRLLVLLVVVPATYFFIYWVPFSLVPLGEARWIADVGALLCTAFVAWFVWVKLGSADQGMISSIFLGAILIGGIGFTAGFFGPMIFAPEANQGPLLGLLITGPLGFLAGGIAGFFYWTFRGKKAQAQ